MGEGVRSRLRLVARSRHYAGRHFLSGPGEERRGASGLAYGLFNSCYSAVADPRYRAGRRGGEHVCVRLVAPVISGFHGLRNGD